jgi:hypothetical protein
MFAGTVKKTTLIFEKVLFFCDLWFMRSISAFLAVQEEIDGFYKLFLVGFTLRRNTSIMNSNH